MKGYPVGLTDLTLPGAIGDIHFGITAATGLDRILAAVVPEKMRLLLTAKRIVKHLEKQGAVLTGKHVTFTVPGIHGTWEARREGPRVVAVPWRSG